MLRKKTFKIDVGLKHYKSHSADVNQACMLELIS